MVQAVEGSSPFSHPRHIQFIPFCGYSTMVSISVFQTEDRSSILLTRTRESKNKHLCLFLVSVELGQRE